MYRACKRYEIFPHKQIHHAITAFSNEEIQILKNFYGKIPLYELLEMLPRWSITAILRKASELHLKCQKETRIEWIAKSILEEIQVNYKQFVKIPYENTWFEIDFLVNDNIALEIQGDYWHGNSEIFTELNEVQQKMVERDIRKKKYLEQQGYKVVYCWENELLNDYESCKNKLIAEMLQR